MQNHVFLPDLRILRYYSEPEGSEFASAHAVPDIAPTS